MKTLIEQLWRARFEAYLLGLAAVGFLMMAAVIVCTPAEKQGAKTVLDIANATCTQIEDVSGSEYVTLSCTAIGVADGIAHVFLARVKRPDAAAMLAKCPPVKP